MTDPYWPASDVTLRPGDPDVRPCVARITARAAGEFGRVEEYVQRESIPSSPREAVGSRAGRIPWVAEVHRRRVRMGIDT